MGVFVFLYLFGQIISLVVILYLIQKRREPQAIVAWSLSFLLFPYLGPFLYFLFGEGRVERKARKRKEKKEGVFYVEPKGPVVAPSSLLGVLSDRLLDGVVPYPFRPGNKVILYDRGEDWFQRFFTAIRSARESIYLEFYSIEGDETGKEFLSLLRKKAEEGVKVYLIYDHIGSLLFHRKYIRTLEGWGVRVSPFSPVGLFRRMFSLNFRTHRKIGVVDHTHAFTGGMNIGNVYRTNRMGRYEWYDLGVEVFGPVVGDIERVFLEDWRLATGEFLPRFSYPEEESEGTTVRVVPSGPEMDFNPLYHLLLALFSHAKKSVTFLTPYFIPTPPLLTLLQNLSLRGVHITPVFPSIGDHLLVQKAGESYFRDLLDFGIPVFLYEPGFLHGKLLLVDQEVAVVGTPNLDIRSLTYNFELSLILVEREDIEKVQQIIGDVLSRSFMYPLMEYYSKSIGERLFRGFSRVISPLF
jgi:cardiolipin synthase